MAQGREFSFKFTRFIGNFGILGILGGFVLLLSAGSAPRPRAETGQSFRDLRLHVHFQQPLSSSPMGRVKQTSISCTGNNSFGIYNNQHIEADLAATGEGCTAPDGTAGLVYPLYFATFASTYNFTSDQISGFFRHWQRLL